MKKHQRQKKEQQHQFSYGQFLAEETKNMKLKLKQKIFKKVKNEDFYDFNETEPQYYLENKEEDCVIEDAKLF